MSSGTNNGALTTTDAPTSRTNLGLGSAALISAPVSVTNGGTGQTSLTAHDLIIGNGTSAVTLLAPSATSGVPVISQGSAADPTFGTVVVAGGGTGATSFTSNGVLYGNGTSAVQITAQGAANSVLVANAGAPSFSATPRLTALGIGANAGVSGLTFDGTNLMGNYVEQSKWTPTLFGGSSAGTTSYSIQDGYYSRVGNTVWLHFLVTYTAATGTGNLMLGGLPFTVKNQANYVPTFAVRIDGLSLPASSVEIVGQLILNTLTGNFVGNTAAGTPAAVQIANTTASVYGSFFYNV